MTVYVNKIVNGMVTSGIIDEADRKIYIFGVSQGVAMLFNVLTTLAIGVVLGMLGESLLFLLFYTPLRIHAGGYHAKTQLRCYLFSGFIVMASLILIGLVEELKLVCILVFLVSATILYVFAPVENMSKPLSSLEKSVYRHRTRIAVLVETSVVGIIFVASNWGMFLSAASIAVMMAAFMMVLGGTLQKRK